MLLNFGGFYSEACVVKLQEFMGKRLRTDLDFQMYLNGPHTLKKTRKEVRITILFPGGALSHSGSNGLLNYLCR